MELAVRRSRGALAFRVIFSEDDVVIWAGTSLWSAVDMSARGAADTSESNQAP